MQIFPEGLIGKIVETIISIGKMIILFEGIIIFIELAGRIFGFVK